MKKMKKILSVIFLLFILGGCTPVLKQPELPKEEIETEREKQREIALNTLIERQIRLYKTGFPLLKGAVNFYTKKPILSLGILIHSSKNYKKEDLPIISKKYRIEDSPTILYVHPHFGAYNAGLKINDRIIEINKKKVESIENISKIMEGIDLSKEKVEVIVDRNGEILTFNVPTTKICPFSFVLYTDPQVGDSINASTDGQTIYATPGLLRFIQSDTELAFVLSHEIAHAVLDHVQKISGNRILGTIVDIAITVATGVNTQGVFGNIAGLVYSKEFEKEADYLGTYIAAISGYDVSDAPNFWRKMAAEYPGSTKDVFLTTHPSSPERYILIEKTVEEIKEKQKKGIPLFPDYKKTK